MAPGEKTRHAIAAQPDWLAQVPTDRRLPDRRVFYAGCGTSFHAAQTGGEAVQALEFVLYPRLNADLMVCVGHEGTTQMTIEAAEVWNGPMWLVTGAPKSPLAQLADEVIVCTPVIEQSWCHTASYTAAVATLEALRGEDVSWMAGAEARGIDPDPIRRDDPRWAKAREAYA